MYDVELKRSGTVPYFGLQGAGREQGSRREAEGKEGKAEVVSAYFRQTFTVEEIAQYTNVPVSFVLEVQEKLSKTKK